MNAVPEIGKFLIVIGIVIVLVGALLWSGFGASWLGRLPGDIRIERGNTAFYFPVVDGRKAELVLHWGTVVVPLSIEVP